MPLEFVKPPAVATVNICLYGPPKTGKSIAAGGVPGPVLYGNADLGAATRLVHKIHGDKIQEVKITGLQTLIDMAHAVRAGDFASVVLDPVGNVFTRVLEGMSGRSLNPAINLYKDAGTHLERFCQDMCEQPVNFVMVGHDFALDDTGDEPDYVMWTGTKNGSPSMSRKLMAMVDVVGYTGVVMPENPEDEKRYVAQLVNHNGRRGGDRFNVLGNARDLDLAEWIETIGRSVTPDLQEAKAA